MLIISAVLSSFFIFASSIKILGWQPFIFETQLAFFKKYGFNRTVMLLVGVIELLGAITLWSNGIIGLVGTALLAATSLGAIGFHVRFDTWKDAIPASFTLLFSSVLLYFKWDLMY